MPIFVKRLLLAALGLYALGASAQSAARPIVSFAPYSTSISAAQGSSTQITLIRTGEMAGTAVIHWGTVNGTAKAGVDFGTAGNATQLQGTVVFSGYETAKTIEVGPAGTIPLLDTGPHTGPARRFSVHLGSTTSADAGLPSIANVDIHTAPFGLLKDIHRSVRFAHDDAKHSYVAKAGSNYVFLMCNELNDCEPWVSDGTRETIRLLKDLRGGGWGSFPQDFTTVGNRVFFVAAGDDAESHVWVTDGTPDGTAMVPLPAGVVPDYRGRVAGVGTRFVFVSSTGDLWGTDGTLAGAALLGHPGVPASISLNRTTGDWIATAGDWAYFAQSDAEHGTELWKTDGTPAGTLLVKDLTPGPTSSSTSRFTVDAGKVYFVAGTSGVPGSALLYVSDGTEAGTYAIGPGSLFGMTSPMVLAGFAYYFVPREDIEKMELWRTDGTPGGTSFVKDWDGLGYPATPWTRAGGRLYFSIGSGPQLWSTDGTTPGTTLVGGQWALHLAEFNGAMMFGNFGVGGVWRTEGSAATTTYLGNWWPEVAVGDTFFMTDGSVNLVVTDGTAAGSSYAVEYPYVPTGDPWDMCGRETISLGATAFFFAHPYPDPCQLWKTDGTPAGTTIVKNLAGGAGPNMALLGGVLYFNASDGLYRTDGTDAGTVQVKAIAQPRYMVATGTGIYLATLNGALWYSDGTPAGTVQVLAATSSSYGIELATAGSTAYFSRPTNAGYELWRSDGTAPSTLRLTFGANSINTLRTSSAGDLYFARSDTATGGELWHSDGTPGGTAIVVDLAPGNTSGVSSIVGVVGGMALFAGPTGTWLTDGTAAGTQPLAGITPHGEGTLYHGHLYFFANDELWRTDGTPASTVAVTSTISAPYQVPRPMQVVGDTLYLLGHDPVNGDELRFLQEPGDLGLVGDFVPGPAEMQLYGGPLRVAALGNGLFLRTGGYVEGFEPYFLTLDRTPDPFSFAIRNGVIAGATIVSDPARISGINAAVTASATNGQVCVSSSALCTCDVQSYAASREVGPGQYVCVRHTASSTVSNFITTTLSVGGVSSTFTSITGFEVGAVDFAPAAYSVTEGQPSVTVTVSRSGSPALDASVTWSIVPGTALEGTDYSGPTSGVINWTAGDGAAKTIVVPIVDDTVPEPSKEFTLTLSSPANVTLGASTTAQVSLADNDPAYAIVEFAPAAYSVTEGQPSVTLSVGRTGSSILAASVAWSIVPGTALSGADYGGPTTGALNWAAGDGAAKTIVIPIVDDAIPEPSKQFTVTLSSPVDMTLGTGTTAQVTVADNDSGFYFAAPTHSVSESGGTVALPVQRVGATTRSGVTVRWTAVSGTALAGGDYGTAGVATAPSGTLTWGGADMTPKNIVIPILQDTLSEGPETFTVVLSAPSPGLAVGNPSTATVTITDDDLAPESRISFAQSKFVGAETGGTFLITVRREAIGGGFTMPASVNATTQPGTATSPADFNPTSGVLTWSTNDATDKTFTVAIANDSIVEPPETFKVLLSSPSAGAQIATPEATVVILDGDEVFPAQGAVPVDWTVPAGATKGWHVSNDAGAYEGVLALRSDAIADNETSQVEVTRTFGAGNITFRVKVSSEANFDRLRFFVDGVEKGSWSGTAAAGWTLFTTPLTAGPHTLRWSYEKDGSASMGSDAAWIDAVTLP